MTHIATVAIGLIQLINNGQHIYTLAANAMDAVEALQDCHLSGENKKIWVMEYVRTQVVALMENWDTYAALISDFIDRLKAAYNAVRGLFND